ncbi:MAG: hypothetical protein ACT4QA_09730 [Panacagrimonas sp.]
MPIPLLGALLGAAAPELAKHGLNLLSGIFRGAAKLGTERVARRVKDKTGIDISQEAQGVSELIREKTGIEVGDIADNKLTEEQWIRLKEFELQHEGQLLGAQASISTHELELERTLNEDRANARATQTERDEHEDPFVRRFTYWYAYLITGLTFLFIFVVVLHPPEKDAPVWRLIDTVLGFLMGVGLSAIIQFFFGSSQGSKDKSDTLRQLAKKNSEPSATEGD